MKKIIIHFSRSTKKFNQFSRLLQWYEGVPISHCLVEFETPNLGQNFVYHSIVGNGVSFLTKKRFLKINEIMETYEIEVNEKIYKCIRNGLLDNCGEQYAMFQNIGIFIVDQLRKFGIKKENPWKDGQNCSELIYQEVIPKIFDQEFDFTPDLIKPSEIRTILLSKYNPTFSKIIDIKN